MIFISLCNSISSYHWLNKFLLRYDVDVPLLLLHFMLNHTADESLIKYIPQTDIHFILASNRFFLSLLFTVLFCYAHHHTHSWTMCSRYLSLSLSFFRRLSLPFVRFCLLTFDLLSMGTVSLVGDNEFLSRKLLHFLLLSVVLQIEVKQKQQRHFASGADSYTHR